MNGFTPFLERYVRVVEQLVASPLVSVKHQESGEDVHDGAGADAVFAELAQNADVHLDDAFRSLYFSSKQLHVVWRLTADGTRGGEFCLQNIAEWAVNGWGPDDWTLPPEEYAKLVDLYTIDYEPHAGSGSVTGISLPEARPLSIGADTQIWYYDAGDHWLEPLDVDYAGYLDSVLLTVGAHGWQYLFADVNLRREVSPSSVAGLEHYLTVLPEIFPAHDYEPLRRRFDARL
ncbi:hypothetical protein [Spirillospora sp. NPDC029432]|uniref:hypothetical protein n=1 Tax=Spirillospora sp. NPDC029432 TaxID=3154599 RepID=UPI00345562F5